MQKIDITIARLRLLLADVSAKEDQLAALRKQFRDQLRRAVEYGVYGDAALDGTLGLMGEVQQRVATTDVTLRDLGLIKARAARELESLQITKRIEAAKSELRELVARQQELEADGALTGANSDIAEQIAQLRAQITQGSEQAAKTLERR